MKMALRRCLGSSLMTTPIKTKRQALYNRNLVDLGSKWTPFNTKVALARDTATQMHDSALQATKKEVKVEV
jgi:hypothetical protein